MPVPPARARLSDAGRMTPGLTSHQTRTSSPSRQATKRWPLALSANSYRKPPPRSKAVVKDRGGAEGRRDPWDHRWVMVNLPKLTPTSTPVPVPLRARETSPLVRACASDDLTAPAAALALA